MPEGPDFWLWQCDSFLRKWATMMIVLPLKGWEFSFGLRHEIELAIDMKVKCIFGQNLKDAVLKYRNGYRTGKGYKDFDALVEQELLDGLVIKGIDYRELEPGEKGSVLYMEKEELEKAHLQSVMVMLFPVVMMQFFSLGIKIH